MSKNAFTLVELLVVVAIIALIAVLGFPSINRAVETSRRAACVDHLRQIGHAMQVYAVDNDGKYPLANDVTWVTWDRTLLNRGLLLKNQLICPSDKVVRTVPGDKRSYAYNGYFGDMKSSQPDTVEGNLLKIRKALSDMILVADCGGPVGVVGSGAMVNVYAYSSCTRNHNAAGANFLYADGHVAWSTDTGSYSSGAESYQLWLKYWRCDLP